jgi:dihydrofolate reductase
MSDINGLNIIVACDEKGGIGIGGSLPWSIPEDLARFKELTCGATLIMGRKTYEEIAKKFPNRTDHILPKRKVIVLSKNRDFQPRGAVKYETLRSAVEDARDAGERDIFVVGGERLFWEALPMTTRVFLTAVEGTYHCDKHFPVSYVTKSGKFQITGGSKGKGCSFIDFHRVAP